MTDIQRQYPLAVEAPQSDVTCITLSLISDLLKKSRDSPRKRILQPLHKEDSDLVHRMFNAMQPGTYITPHRHMTPPKTETVIVISGAMLYVEFEDSGECKKQILLQPGTETFGIDIAPHVYHTFIVLKENTLLFEVKDGPYVTALDKDIPKWASKEGSSEAESFQLALIKQLAERAKTAAENERQEEENNAEENE